MMSIGRSSGRENLLWVTGIEPMKLIRTHLANHIRASSREEWLHQQARHMTAPDRNRRHAKKCLTARRRPHMTHNGPPEGVSALYWSLPLGVYPDAPMQCRMLLSSVL